MPEITNGLLDIADLRAGYGTREVLQGISLCVPDGKILAIIGHNGAGKSTLLKALFGLVSISSGRIELSGKPFDPSPSQALRLGIAYLPQGKCVFDELTVRENLEIGDFKSKDPQTRVTEGLRLFPDLKNKLNRTAGSLSGGEQQMLGLCSALILSPRLLMIDEPSLGLAPHLVLEIFHRIREICLGSSTSVLIVEQKVREVLKIADHVCVLRNGRVSFFGCAEDLSDDEKLREVYL